MKHCLEICVTLTEEFVAVLPPSHSWMAPLMEDMLCNARIRLTIAVVTGPGRAVLFYGRYSMGEGLTTDEARDATFLLTGTGMWVGKSAYLAADPMTIQATGPHCTEHVHPVEARQYKSSCGGKEQYCILTDPLEENTSGQGSSSVACAQTP